MHMSICPSYYLLGGLIEIVSIFHQRYAEFASGLFAAIRSSLSTDDKKAFEPKVSICVLLTYYDFYLILIYVHLDCERNSFTHWSASPVWAPHRWHLQLEEQTRVRCRSSGGLCGGPTCARRSECDLFARQNNWLCNMNVYSAIICSRMFGDRFYWVGAESGPHLTLLLGFLRNSAHLALGLPVLSSRILHV